MDTCRRTVLPPRSIFRVISAHSLSPFSYSHCYLFADRKLKTWLYHVNVLVKWFPLYGVGWYKLCGMFNDLLLARTVRRASCCMCCWFIMLSSLGVQCCGAGDMSKNATNMICLGFKVLLCFWPLGARKRSYIRTRHSLWTSTWVLLINNYHTLYIKIK